MSEELKTPGTLAPARAWDRTRVAACLQYIENYWQVIVVTQPEDEGTLIGLPRPFVVPNHLIFKELYYWDSFFICAGLKHTSRSLLVTDIVENFLYLFRRFQRIPNGSRYYYLSRSQPPLLSSLILLAHECRRQAGEEPAALRQWTEESIAVAKREYDVVWRGKTFPDLREVHAGLSRYFDINIWHDAAEAESGWDMTPRFENRCLDFLPVDLNALLYKYEADFFELSTVWNRSDAAQWAEQMARRREQMSELMWDDATGYFYDFDYARGRRSSFRSIAGFFPLFAGLATEQQASSIVRRQLPFFETPYGLITTEEWHPGPNEITKQWAWPNGWAPLHWIAVNGLLRYGYKEEACRIAEKWVSLVNGIFEETGEIFEKYDVVRGARAVPDRYPDQPGFGWTNAVFLAFVNLLSDGGL